MTLSSFSVCFLTLVLNVDYNINFLTYELCIIIVCHYIHGHIDTIV